MRMLPLAALAALALAPTAIADEPAVTVVTPKAADVQVTVGKPGDVAVVPRPDADTGAVIPAPPRTVTVVYVYPTSPQTFVPVASLPSYLVQPGAPLPQIANFVVQSVPIPVLAGTPVAAAADLDCSDLNGPVFVGAADPHHLDRNGNGIGCEPGE